MTASIHHSDYQLLLRVLKDERQAKGVSQIALAARLGTTQSFISKVERGERRIDVVELIEILESLEIDPVRWTKNYLTVREAEHKKSNISRKISG